MDSPDLTSLLLHFDHKIRQIDELIPWAKTCNLLVQRQDNLLTDQEQEQPDVQLPDLHLLSELIMDMEESIYEIDDQMALERKRTERQKIRIQNLITDLKQHLDYISSNFPLNFGKSPEKPKIARYGIHAAANARKSVAPAAKSAPTRQAAGVRPGVRPAAGTARSAASGRTNAGPTANTNNKPVDTKPEPVPRKSVVAPTVLSGPALVGSKKPAIPVRMTKKLLAQFNHNVNKNLN